MVRHRVDSANTVLPSRFVPYSGIQRRAQVSDDLAGVQSFIGHKLKAQNIQKGVYERPVNGLLVEDKPSNAGSTPQNVQAELHNHVFNKGMLYSHLFNHLR